MSGAQVVELTQGSDLLQMLDSTAVHHSYAEVFKQLSAKRVQSILFYIAAVMCGLRAACAKWRTDPDIKSFVTTVGCDIKLSQ
jgi:hypothetical protein